MNNDYDYEPFHRELVSDEEMLEFLSRRNDVWEMVYQEILEERFEKSEKMADEKSSDNLETIEVHGNAKQYEDDDYFWMDRLEDEWEKTNKKYLDIFESDIRTTVKDKKKIEKYMDYADTYVNFFLLKLLDESGVLGPEYKIDDDNHVALENGCEEINTYISYYYIEADSSASPYNLWDVVRSIKYFYKSMYEHGIVKKKYFDDLCSTIKSEMPLWLEDCKEMYNKAFDDEW